MASVTRYAKNVILDLEAVPHCCLTDPIPHEDKAVIAQEVDGQKRLTTFAIEKPSSLQKLFCCISNQRDYTLNVINVFRDYICEKYDRETVRAIQRITQIRLRDKAGLTVKEVRQMTATAEIWKQRRDAIRLALISIPNPTIDQLVTQYFQIGPTRQPQKQPPILIHSSSKTKDLVSSP